MVFVAKLELIQSKSSDHKFYHHLQSLPSIEIVLLNVLITESCSKYFTLLPLLTAVLILVELTEKNKLAQHQHLQDSPNLH